MVQKYCAFGVLAPLPPKHGRAQWSIERLLDSPPPLPEAFHKSGNVTGFMIRNKLRKTPESSGLLANPLFQQTSPKSHVAAVQIELVFAEREGWHHTAKVCRSSSQPTELKTRDEDALLPTLLEDPNAIDHRAFGDAFSIRCGEGQ